MVLHIAFRLTRSSMAAVAVALAIGFAVPAAAQISETERLLNRLSRVERDIQTLNQQIFRGDVPTTAPSGEGFSGSYAGQVEVRLTELERQLQTLTGRIEELQFQNRSLSQRLDRALTDIEFRLTTLEGGEIVPPVSDAATGAAPAPALPSTPPVASTSGPPAASPSVTTPTPSDPAPSGQLGTLTLSEPVPAGTAPAAASDLAPIAPTQGGATEQYNQAFNLLQGADYGGAESAFKRFLEQHGDTPLASNAQYWLGETFYVRGRFPEASVAFAQGYQRFPDGPKALDSLVKLGMTLGAMGQTDDACVTFAQIGDDFPDAPNTVLRRVEQERDRFQCS
ncbi:MAG: tol-pal system protein YbgF [Inquilinaceae bacterium]